LRGGFALRLPKSGRPDKESSIGFQALSSHRHGYRRCDQQPSRGPGHPPSETVRVVATLRRFLREGTPWRSLTATPDQASGSTLRRVLARWAETGVLAKVHALLATMLRGHPDLILDTCSVRAKRGCIGRSKFRPRGGGKTGHRGGHWLRMSATKILYHPSV
jgi:hypothetical protein